MIGRDKRKDEGLLRFQTAERDLHDMYFETQPMSEDTFLANRQQARMGIVEHLEAYVRGDIQAVDESVAMQLIAALRMVDTREEPGLLKGIPKPGPRPITLVAAGCVATAVQYIRLMKAARDWCKSIAEDPHIDGGCEKFGTTPERVLEIIALTKIKRRRPAPEMRAQFGIDDDPVKSVMASFAVDRDTVEKWQNKYRDQVHDFRDPFGDDGAPEFGTESLLRARKFMSASGERYRREKGRG